MTEVQKSVDGVKPVCPDCVPAPINHTYEYWSNWNGNLFSPLNNVLNVFYIKTMQPLMIWLHPGRISPALFRFFVRIKLGTIVTEADSHHNSRTKALWESAKKRGIEIYGFRFFGKVQDILIARHQGELVVFNSVPRPQGIMSPALNWMDDKALLRKKFTRAGIPMASGKALRNLSQAKELFQEIGGPLITKPHQGSRSRHTTIHINDLASLEVAFKKAQQLSPIVIVERELQGLVYRATVVAGKVVGVISRVQPFVTGDGVHTVRELIQEENKNPLRQGTFHTIEAGDEAQRELIRQELNWDSVPAQGQTVTLNQKVSRDKGAVTVDVTDQVHPDNIKLFERVAEVLNDPLVGIDVIFPDISKSWHSQEAGIIECNSAPFIDLHHYPYIGEPRDAAGALWDVVFPAAKAH